jgi:hypothetical protein
VITNAQYTETPRIFSSLETNVEIKYIREERLYKFEFPFYGNIEVLHKTPNLESVFSIEYIGELGLGETYILGGTDFSHMKIGYYVENWGTGYSLSPLGSINPLDNRYPQNIFYRTNYKPVPRFTMTIGDQSFHQQISIINREENIETVDDSDLGLRGIWTGPDSSASIGFVRKFGYPPPLFYLTAETIGDREHVWLELGWEYHKTSRDVWTFILGFMREFSSTELRLEYIVERGENFLFLEEAVIQNELAKFNLKIFFNVPDFSSAYNGFISLVVAEYLTFEPGFFLFLGKDEKYFTPNKTDNNNTIYFKLKYEFL